MKKILRVFYSQIFNAFFPILIVAILLKLPGQNYTASVFLLINFANVYLLFSDYSANISFVKNALQTGGITQTGVSQVITKNIHDYIGIKAIILGLGFVVWVIVCWAVPLLHGHAASNMLAYLFIIGYNLNFYWVYISSNKEYFFILSNFLSRLWLLLLLVIFGWFRLDFFYLMVTAGLGSIFITIAFFLRFAFVYKIKVSLSKTQFREAAAVIKKDWPLVTNSFLLMSPTICLSLFIGFVKNTEYVIVYGLTEKIFLGIRSLLSVFVNSIYPVFCNPNSVSRNNIRRIFVIFYLLLISGCAVLYFISPILLPYFKLPDSLNAVYLYCLLYFLLTLISISINVPVFLWLLVHNVINSKKALIFLVIAAILITTIFTANTIFNNGVAGIVQSLFAAESIIALTFFLLYKRSRLDFAGGTIASSS